MTSPTCSTCPGASIINTRDVTSGEALHIVIKRGDETYLRFLLQKGADPNLRDGRGNTPLAGGGGGQPEMIRILTAARPIPTCPMPPARPADPRGAAPPTWRWCAS
jgi:hypothetical protein